MTKFREFVVPFAWTDLMRYFNGLDKTRRWLVRVSEYKRNRSVEQNAVSHGWYAQISRELGEDTPGEVKSECKLLYGIPILRADPDFDVFYRHLDRLSYTDRLAAMKYIDVTSLMNTTQMQEYMTAMQDAYADRVRLVYPNDPPEFYE